MCSLTSTFLIHDVDFDGLRVIATFSFLLDLFSGCCCAPSDVPVSDVPVGMVRRLEVERRNSANSVSGLLELLRLEALLNKRKGVQT